MRKLSNGAVGVIAAAVCIFITVLTMDTDAFSMAFNLAVLAVMLVILAFPACLALAGRSRRSGGWMGPPGN